MGSTGYSVIKYFKKKKIQNFYVWDDNPKKRGKLPFKIPSNLNNTLKDVDYIVLSPGISLKKKKK